MGRLRLLLLGTLIVTLLLSGGTGTAASGPAGGTVSQLPPVPTVVLRAASGATIHFRTQNGQAKGGVPSETLKLPHLVLFRNAALTDPGERTLIVEVTGIDVPPDGMTVVLEVSTIHEDPDRPAGSTRPIELWRASQWLAHARGSAQANVTAVFTHEFTGTVTSGPHTVPTPTDYFHVDVTLGDGTSPARATSRTFHSDYAFLMENQWIVRLPEVGEQRPGAAPDELILHYCDMFPFGRGLQDPATEVHRSDVPDFIQRELLPEMAEAFRLQSDVWGLPWPEAWTSLRPEDGAKRLSVALTDGRTWYHGRALMTGCSLISLNVSSGASERYRDGDALVDGLMSTFHHELFHNLQRAIHQALGGNGALGFHPEAWEFFSEGTAVLASSVAQPNVHFSESGVARRYVLSANLFPAHNTTSNEILPADSAVALSPPYARNAPTEIPDASDPPPARPRGYETMPSPAAALVWRFLYERCGGMHDGIEDPAAGMAVIRRALTALYSGEIVDPATSTDLVESLPAIMDRTLAESSCPFQTYEESLLHLARAIYALTLEGGRCTGPGLSAGCGFYDPNGLYLEPPVGTVTYIATDQRIPGAIRTSFGMAFVDVLLVPMTDGRPLTIEFAGAPGSEAEFRVQVWKLMDQGPGRRPRRIPAQIAAPEVLGAEDTDGRLVVTIPTIDLTEFDRLGLIITRVDTRESADPIGEYTIRLRPDTDAVG